MNTLPREFFELNSSLVFFVYGQVFFVLGLAIALQSRRHSRLALSRSLGWLAAFGVTHGLHEWGHVFIPIQAQYAGAVMITVLRLAQDILLALSFGFLFQFGAELLREHWRGLPAVPLLLTILWGLLFVMPGIAMGDEILPSVWARYLLGFPGALLAAWGLRYQAERQIKPLGLHHIYGTLRLAGLALATYAILAGLIVPAASFFPANTLNQEAILVIFGMPVAVFRSLTGLVMAAAVIRALDIFDLEIDQRIEQLEMEQSLAAERERIARDLHDGNIQQVYTVGLMMESAQRRLPADPEKAAERLARAMSGLNEVITSLRAYMNTLQREPPEESFEEGLHRFAVDERYAGLVEIDVSVEPLPKLNLNSAQLAHVWAIVNEALANAARHAQAQRVQITALQANGDVQLTVQDNGRGFAPRQQLEGFGLRNMHDRARLVGGHMTIVSKPDQGTVVTLTIPCKEC
jgi:signal transduction histidine kinase